MTKISTNEFKLWQQSWKHVKIDNNIVEQMITFKYATGHNSFMSHYLLNIYIYCRLCRLKKLNGCIKKIFWEEHEERDKTEKA
jgi:hypothetical protein